MKKLCLIIIAMLSTVMMAQAATTDKRPRILVSTDIGGTDPDDNQSMAHLLMYSEMFRIEGLVSSPSYGDGSVSEIHRMIDLYALDLPKLQQHVAGLATPEYLHSVTKQGRHGRLPLQGYDNSTEGSQWIVECARKESDEPLWVLVWGGLDDVAQALHDAPDIADKIRVVWIGGPNKKWGVNGYRYIAMNFPNIWMIENNASYRGFLADKRAATIFNNEYYDTFIRGAGHLGEDFIKYYKGLPKMGDTPTLLYMMHGDPNVPEGESWGGSFEKIDRCSRIVYHRATTLQDTVNVYSLVEFHFKGPKKKMKVGTPCFEMKIDKQMWEGYYMGKGEYMCVYSPKEMNTLTYETVSDIPAMNGLTGAFVVNDLWPGYHSETDLPLGNNWYSDKEARELYYKDLQGFKTTSIWREKVLADWAVRWSWLK